MLAHQHGESCLCNTKNPFVHARVDPTKTTVLRSKFERDLVSRFRRLRDDIVARILDEIDELITNAPADKHQKFMKWLDGQIKDGILEVKKGPTSQTSNVHWQNLYLKAAYKKGSDMAAQKIKRAGGKVQQSWIDSGFNRPFHADRVGLIYTRAYNDLEGITKAMDTKISAKLAEGMAAGQAPKVIAKELAKAVDTIGIYRARVLARTEVVRAHAEATLNTYEEANIEGVEVESEFTTSNDNKVCPKCAELEGKTYSMSEARGVIPVHPNCRCAWVPKIIDGIGVELR